MIKTKTDSITVCDCATGDDALAVAMDIVDEMSQVRCLEWLLTVSELIENLVANVVLKRVRDEVAVRYTDADRVRMMSDTHTAVTDMLLRNSNKAQSILASRNADVSAFIRDLLDREIEDHTDIILENVKP